jgi:hypothetical protein
MAEFETEHKPLYYEELTRQDIDPPSLNSPKKRHPRRHQNINPDLISKPAKWTTISSWSER